MNSFIKVVEVWVPTPNGTDLVLADGIFDNCEGLLQDSRAKRFAFGEGLPGRAWQTASPQVIIDLANSYFLRKQAAAESGLTAGIAVPVFSGEFLKAVVVFLCGDMNYQAGAIELWEKDSSEAKEMKLSEGYYGSLKKLEEISQKMRFSKGDGLPGAVWDYQIPLLVDDVLNSPFFQRGGYAMVEGITTAFALPLSYYTGKEFVLTFLSAYATPIAHRYEIWLPDREHKVLFLHDAKCQFDANHLTRQKEVSVKRGIGLLGKSWLTGCPYVSSDLSGDALVTDESRYSLEKGMTLPIIEDGILRSLVVLMF